MTPIELHTDSAAAVFLGRVQPAQKLEHVLTETERRRCARFRQQADRDRYVSLRALLRQVLRGRGLEKAELVREASGKPRMGWSAGGSGAGAGGAVSESGTGAGGALGAGAGLPEISLTKCGQWVALALLSGEGCAAHGIAAHGPEGPEKPEGRQKPSIGVGIDLESTAAVDQPGFAHLVCTRAEARALERLPAEAQPAEKLRLWTGKEALLKTSGEGLLRDPRSVAVGTPGPGGEALLPGPGTAQPVQLQHLTRLPETGMGMSIAVAGVEGSRRARTRSDRAYVDGLTGQTPGREH